MRIFFSISKTRESKRIPLENNIKVLQETQPSIFGLSTEAYDIIDRNVEEILR